MENWKYLDEETEKICWNFIKNEINFKPDFYSNLLAYSDYISYVVYDFKDFYDDNFNLDYYNDFHVKTQRVFRNSRNPTKLYALSWQHQCYLFDSTKEFELDEFEEWLIEIFPDGDYCFFVDVFFENCLFIDGINEKIYVFGDEFLRLFDIYSPVYFQKTDSTDL